MSEKPLSVEEDPRWMSREERNDPRKAAWPVAHVMRLIAHADLMDEVLAARDARLAEVEAECAALRERFTAPIVCMCGSTKFKQAWVGEKRRLTLDGAIVLDVGLFGHHEPSFGWGAVKSGLDDLHKRKIDLCDWVWVLDVGGYIGESTRSEIEYAEKIRRPVRYLSKEFPNYAESVDPVIAERDDLLREVEALRERVAELEDVDAMMSVAIPLLIRLRVGTCPCCWVDTKTGPHLPDCEYEAFFDRYNKRAWRDWRAYMRSRGGKRS